MSFLIEAEQYAVANQSIRNRYIQVNLLDFNFFTVDSLGGRLIDGSIDINANSDIRRTCSVNFVVTDSSFNVEAGGKIWLDKYFQIYIGVEDLKTGEIVWTNTGIFLINQPSFMYDVSTRTMSFHGVDLMAKMTGLRNGYITGIGSDQFTLIPVGSNVREVMIAVLQECGFNRYVIRECQNTDGVIQDVPYDMQFEQGATWYEILAALRDILPNYQIYFDVDGVFHYEKIPSGVDDPVIITEEIWENNLIQENLSIDFENVKNFIEVWGRVHDTEDFSDSTMTLVTDNIIEPTWSALTELADYIITALSLPSAITSSSGIYIYFNDETLIIKDYSDNNITYLPADEYLTFSYDATDSCWRYLGGLQAHATYEDDNPESPFYVGGTIGRIALVLSGEEYENIVSDDLALERAKFEIYNHCRLNDTINLTTIPIYWADVNLKVSYTNLSGDKTSKEYMIQSVNIPLAVDGVQTWNLSRFYPFYPII